MRRILLMTIVALCWGECSLAGYVSKYDAGGVPDIHPKGWLLTLMQRQHDGLTVFPDTKAQPSEQPVPDYTRPADAPECVQAEDDRYCAYFELPRFCWDEPVWCKVHKAGDDVNLHSNKDGDLCVMVGTTANGRKIWKWTGPAVTEEAPKEIIFTNHDLLTPIMSFANGGYYHYDRLMYKAGQTSPTGVKMLKADDDDAVGYYYDLQGRRYTGKPTSKGVIINRGKKVVW